MSVSIVWIDQVQAKLFRFSDERMEREVVRVSHPDHHTHSKHEELHPALALYDTVANKLQGTRRLLILGPGVARTQFLHRLEERHPQLFSKVLDCIPSDHPTDQQVASYALEYLQRPAL